MPQQFAWSSGIELGPLCLQLMKITGLWNSEISSWIAPPWRQTGCTRSPRLAKPLETCHVTLEASREFPIRTLKIFVWGKRSWSQAPSEADRSHILKPLYNTGARSMLFRCIQIELTLSNALGASWISALETSSLWAESKVSAVNQPLLSLNLCSAHLWELVLISFPKIEWTKALSSQIGSIRQEMVAFLTEVYLRSRYLLNIIAK